jgi:hypothetical protein
MSEIFPIFDGPRLDIWKSMEADISWCQISTRVVAFGQDLLTSGHHFHPWETLIGAKTTQDIMRFGILNIVVSWTQL